MACFWLAALLAQVPVLSVLPLALLQLMTRLPMAPRNMQL
jgi:hypothetical protein